MKISQYNSPKSKIGFSSFNFKKLDNVKIFEDFKAKLINNDKEMDCFVRMKTAPNRFFISVNTNDNKILGENTSNTLHEGILYNCIINNISHNPKIKGIGSVMRLGDIIMTLENKIPKIQLFSIGQAVYFHSKFKFEPAITDFMEIKSYIGGDIANKLYDKRFSKFTAKALKWLDSDNIPKIEKIKQGNKLVYEYIAAVNKYKLNRDEDFILSPGFDMELKREDVIKNKDFFNKLFKKSGIDYQISDCDSY